MPESYTSIIMVFIVVGVHLVRQPAWRAGLTAVLGIISYAGVYMTQSRPWLLHTAFVLATAAMLYSGYRLSFVRSPWGKRRWNPERAFISVILGMLFLDVYQESLAWTAATHQAGFAQFSTVLIICGFVALFTRRAFFAWLTVLYSLLSGALYFVSTEATAVLATSFILLGLGFLGFILLKHNVGGGHWSTYTPPKEGEL